jgi:hypothetical protein
MGRATYEVEPSQTFTAIIGGQPNELGEFSPSYLPPSLAPGTVGVQVRPLEGGGAVIPRMTTPREQAPNSAIYAANLTAPAETGSYTVLWDDNSGNPPFLTQTLEVGVIIPVTGPGSIPGDGVAGDKPVYITPCVEGDPPTNEDLQAVIPGLVIDNLTIMNQLIVDCEWEIDSILGLWTRDPTTGRKINPNNIVQVATIIPYASELFAPLTRGITIYQLHALRRAVCAQVEYHLKMGEDFFLRPHYTTVSGPQFSRTGETPDRIAPKARQHLAGTGLQRMTARLAV